ncbi:hypothetical protein GLYMA_09G235850v4 [Glycine max]|nr:hypothetical protein GLYMA_09G235850v4 [Glycine max]KAH1044482.1 hypothetical protein GYH30_025973 [Glycine max]
MMLVSIAFLFSIGIVYRADVVIIQVKNQSCCHGKRSSQVKKKKLRWSSVNVSLLILLNLHFTIEICYINN